MAQFRKCWSEICSAALWGFTILGSSLTVAPARSPPAGQHNPDTRGWCSLWATAPPAPLSPEGGDTCETKATQPVSRRRGSGGRGGGGEHRLESVVHYDLRPARSHHQVLIVVLDGDRIAGGFFQQLHLCECLHRGKRYKRNFFKKWTEFRAWQEVKRSFSDVSYWKDESVVSLRFEFFHLYRCSSGPRQRRLCRS